MSYAGFTPLQVKSESGLTFIKHVIFNVIIYKLILSLDCKLMRARTKSIGVFVQCPVQHGLEPRFTVASFHWVDGRLWT